MCKGMVIPGAWLVILLAILHIQGGDITKKLPSMLYLVRYGCSAKGPVYKINHEDPMGRARKVWVVRAFAEHKGLFDKKAVRNWQAWLADASSLEAGNKVCMKWMKRVSKASYRWRLEQKVKIVEPREKKE